MTIKKELDIETRIVHTDTKEILETVDELSKQLDHISPNIVDSGPIIARMCKSILSNDGPKG